MTTGIKHYYANGAEIREGDIARRLCDHGWETARIAGHVKGTTGSIRQDGAQLYLLPEGGVEHHVSPHRLELVSRSAGETMGQRLHKAGWDAHCAWKKRNEARAAVVVAAEAYNAAVEALHKAQHEALEADKALTNLAAGEHLPDTQAEFIESPIVLRTLPRSL